VGRAKAVGPGLDELGVALGACAGGEGADATWELSVFGWSQRAA
jgi:hypothetical protein